MTREEMLDRAVREQPSHELQILLMAAYRATLFAHPVARRIRHRFTQIAAIEGLRAKEAAQ